MVKCDISRSERTGTMPNNVPPLQGDGAQVDPFRDDNLGDTPGGREGVTFLQWPFPVREFQAPLPPLKH